MKGKNEKAKVLNFTQKLIFFTSWAISEVLVTCAMMTHNWTRNKEIREQAKLSIMPKKATAFVIIIMRKQDRANPISS